MEVETEKGMAGFIKGQLCYLCWSAFLGTALATTGAGKYWAFLFVLLPME